VPIRADTIARALEAALQVAATSDAEVREQIRTPLRPWEVNRMAERFVGAVRRAREV
jgi:hypothetical protein